jgi:hypothetical protein
VIRLATVFSIALLMVAMASAAEKPSAAPAIAPKRLKLESLEFFATANVSAFNINGIAKSLDGEAQFTPGGINQVTARVPVSALTTRMALRDKHMGKRVFETKDGKQPDLVLSASGIKCVDAGSRSRSRWTSP